MRSKFNTVFASAAAVLMSLSVPGAALAATLDVSSINGNWTGLYSGNGQTPTYITGLNTNSVSWGTPHVSSLTGRQSGYSFLGAAAGQIESDTDFNLGTFTHRNFVLNPGTSIAGAGLGLVVNMVIGGVNRALTTAFNFSHDETLNNGESNGLCKNGGANNVGVNSNGCADRVSILDNTGQQEAFEVNGFLYILEITGFIQNGQAFTEFWTREDAENSASLRARFTLVGAVAPVDRVVPIDPVVPSPVPLPAAGWMVLTGLGALAAMRARRRKS